MPVCLICGEEFLSDCDAENCHACTAIIIYTQPQAHEEEEWKRPVKVKVSSAQLLSLQTSSFQAGRRHAHRELFKEDARSLEGNLFAHDMPICCEMMCVVCLTQVHLQQKHLLVQSPITAKRLK